MIDEPDDADSCFHSDKYFCEVIEMIPFVAGVLSGMAAQKLIDAKAEEVVFEPVEMREVSEEYVNETLSKSRQIPAREVSNDELPQYIRDKLAALEKAEVVDK